MHPIITALQASGESHIIMSRCDINVTEEAAFVEHNNIATSLKQIIHSGNIEQHGARHMIGQGDERCIVKG